MCVRMCVCVAVLRFCVFVFLPHSPVAAEPVVLSALSWGKLSGEARGLVAQLRMLPLDDTRNSPAPGEKR